jgi:hypothetical protein
MKAFVFVSTFRAPRSRAIDGDHPRALRRRGPDRQRDGISVTGNRLRARSYSMKPRTSATSGMACIEYGVNSPHIWKRRCPICYMRHYRRQRRFKVRICEACRTKFTTSRLDAKFCSPKCRQRAHRARKTVNRRHTDRATVTGAAPSSMTVTMSPYLSRVDAISARPDRRL